MELDLKPPGEQKRDLHFFFLTYWIEIYVISAQKYRWNIS